MSRICIIILLLLCCSISNAQEVFQRGNHYGLKHDGKESYAAVFDEIKIHQYFAAGRMGSVWFNLSKKKENSQKAYRKFYYKLLDKLLVIGYTTQGKVDILNENGEILYLEDGPYNKVLNKEQAPGYGNDDMLVVRKQGKVGVYNWVLRKEILPPAFTKIVIHESCEFGQYFIYSKSFFTHSIWDESGNELLKFKAPMVTDIYPDQLCKGYIIQWQHKKGYCLRKRDGSYFLIKPKYDDIYFPKGDPSVIIVENRERKGLFVNYTRLLKCKFDDIQYVDEPYILAKAKKNDVAYKVKKNGELVVIRE